MGIVRPRFFKGLTHFRDLSVSAHHFGHFLFISTSLKCNTKLPGVTISRGCPFCIIQCAIMVTLSVIAFQKIYKIFQCDFPAIHCFLV